LAFFDAALALLGGKLSQGCLDAHLYDFVGCPTHFLKIDIDQFNHQCFLFDGIADVSIGCVVVALAYLASKQT